MKAFYKIEEGKAQVGSGTIIPDDFVEYVVGEEPTELIELLKIDKDIQRIQSIKSKAGEIINQKYNIYWQLNHPRVDVAFAKEYAWIDAVRDMSNELESDVSKTVDDFIIEQIKE